MASNEKAIGIDLGTTYSAVARIDELGRPVTLVNAEGDWLPGLVADRYGGAIRRAALPMAVNGARKRRQLVRFALAASARLQRLADPGI